MTLLSGTRLGPYQVTGLLGSGGMAEVYRARDTRLGREVAIKILPEELSNDPESLARFTREARTASALNHPNLVTIYDIGDVEWGRRRLHYIAMELIRGETLRYHLAHDDRDVLLRYLAGVGDGLAKAHDAGVVHRDLKPENILVSEDDFAKVVDFGLAKRAPGFLGQSSISDLTAEGFCVGTAGYMAPEQVRAQRDIDSRADIFALGCMLYEIIAKENPFDGVTPFDTMLRVLTHEPPPLPDPVLEPIVRRCIAKNREERYASMREAAAELRKSVTPAIGTSEILLPRKGRRPAIASIAVLPFHNRSGNEEMRFLSDGIPEDVVRSLGRIRTLRVIASSSAARFRDTTDPQ
jgi:serine/threonine protein kinase